MRRILVGSTPSDPSTQEAGVYPLPVISGKDGEPLSLSSFAQSAARLYKECESRPDDEFILDPAALFGERALKDVHYRQFFRVRPKNLSIPTEWRTQDDLHAARPIRIIVFGSRSYQDETFLFERMDRLCSRLRAEDILGISGRAKGADQAGERWFQKRGIPFLTYEAHWDDLDAPRAVVKNRNNMYYNARAGFDRNAAMALACTHAVGFLPDRAVTPGTGSMLQLARAMSRVVRVCSPSGRVIEQR